MSATLDHAVERLLRRDRLLVLARLVVMTLLAWVYLVALTLQMDMGQGMGGTGNDPRTVSRSRPSKSLW